MRGPGGGAAPGSEAEERAARAGAVGGGGGGRGGGGQAAQAPLLVGVRQGQAAAQHLPEHGAELPRGHVVQQRVDDRAQVEEGVGEREQDHVRLEVGPGPVVLGPGGSHDPPDLVGHPADGQGQNDQP